MRNITLNNWNSRTWWRGRRADGGWRGVEQADAPKGQLLLRPPGPMQGVLGEGGFPSPNPFFYYSSGSYIGQRPSNPKGPELRGPKGGREERGGEGFPRKGPEGAPRGEGR